MQLTHYTSKFESREFPIILICDNIRNAPNIGGLLRIADAFGVDRLFFCGADIPLGKRMKKTSRSTENYVNYTVVDDINDVLKGISKSHQVIALEITTNSEPLHNFKLSQSKPLALLIGNENFGLSENVLDQCDCIVHIDMFGKNSSMNVVQAASIALYEFTKQLSL